MSRLKPLQILAGALALALVLPMAGVSQDTGSADFTRYVAVGDSLTAGFMSGGLFQTAQQNSYPILIWRQATGQTSGFEQPLVSDPGIPAALELRGLAPLTIAPRAGRGNPLNLNLQRPYNNLAVPGADVHDAVATVTDNGVDGRAGTADDRTLTFYGIPTSQAAIFPMTEVQCNADQFSR